MMMMMIIIIIIIISVYNDIEVEVIRMWKVRGKIVPFIIRALRTFKKGLRSEPSVAHRSPVGHRATEGRTNEQCAHHSYSAGVNRFDLLLRSGLTRRPPPNN